MTITAEKSQISRAFRDSHTKRSYEISEMKQSLVRQIKEGRSSARLMSSELHESIQRDLKNISEHVTANRSAASNLVLRYKAGRKVSAKALKAMLEADRTRLTVKIKKMMLGLEHDRITARASNRSYIASRKAKLKQSVVSPSQAKTSSPAPVTSPSQAKTSSREK